jgi:hypothetical protein
MPADSEPLFVLRYRRNLRAGIILAGSLLALFLGTMALVAHGTNAKDLVLRASMGFIVLLCLFWVIDLALFSEVRLYRDRIVKHWNLLGEREVRLANAKLKGRGYLGRVEKICFEQESSWLWVLLGTYFREFVSYREELADPKDVKELNRLLAELSGRKVEEFERPEISMPRLIKGDTNHV